jgi:spore coat protein SA
MSIICLAPGTFPFPPAGCTSVEIYVWHLARELAASESVLLYGKADERAHHSTEGKLTVKTFPAKDALSYLRSVLSDLKRTASPSLIHIENRIPFVSRIKRRFPETPLVLNLHSNVLLQSLPRSIIQTCFRHTDALVVNSHFLKQDLLERFPFLPEEKVHVIYPGIDLTQFPPRFSASGAALRADIRKRFNIPEDRQIVLTVGRFTPRKGFLQVIEAFREVHAEHPNSELWIIGGRPWDEENPFHALLREKAHGLPVRFLGFLRQCRLPAYYAAADLFVCASQLPEAFGLVNLEASAAGLPVLASGRWGLLESVQHGVSGLLVVAYNDPSAIAAGIKRLLSSREQRDWLGTNGRLRVESQFSWHKTALGFLKLYDRLRET